MSKPIFALHSNSFSERADSVNLINIQNSLQKYHDIESLIVIPKDSLQKNYQRIQESKKKGNLIVEYKNRKQLEALTKSTKVTHFYTFSDGRPESNFYFDQNVSSSYRILDIPLITHVVFRNFKPHGDYYFFVSQWLLKSYYRSKEGIIKNIIQRKTDPAISYWPHIIETESGDRKKFLKKYKIKENQFFVGRVGGYDQFSDPHAKAAIYEILDERKDITFIFINTKEFIRHSRVIYIPYLNRTEIWDFYATISLAINARLQGESFGFSIVEPLSIGKPVIAPHFIRNLRMDKHHITLLRNLNLLYREKNDFKKKVFHNLENPPGAFIMKKGVECFKPQKVIDDLLIKLDL